MAARLGLAAAMEAVGEAQSMLVAENASLQTALAASAAEAAELRVVVRNLEEKLRLARSSEVLLEVRTAPPTPAEAGAGSGRRREDQPCYKVHSATSPQRGPSLSRSPSPRSVSLKLSPSSLRAPCAKKTPTLRVRGLVGHERKQLNGQYTIVASDQWDGAGVWRRLGKLHVPTAYIFRGTDDHRWFIGTEEQMRHCRGSVHQSSATPAFEVSPVGLVYNHYGVIEAMAPQKRRERGTTDTGLPLDIVVAPTSEAARKGHCVRRMLLGPADSAALTWQTKELRALEEASFVVAVPAGAVITSIELATTGHCEARVEEYGPVGAAALASGAAQPKKKALLPWRRYGSCNCRDGFGGELPKHYEAEERAVRTTATMVRILVRHTADFGSAGLALFQLH